MEDKETWDRLKKLAYEYLDTLDLKTIIKTYHNTELNALMDYIENIYGDAYLSKYNFNKTDECIFNRINESDFESYLYKRYKDNIYISWDERGYVHFRKEK